MNAMTQVEKQICLPIETLSGNSAHSLAMNKLLN
jgi:hypothetical protein